MNEIKVDQPEDIWFYSAEVVALMPIVGLGWNVDALGCYVDGLVAAVDC